MIILVINSGSSSIKYQLFDISSGGARNLLCKGLVERIGSEKSSLSHQKTGCETIKKSVSAIGHRVVHGGEEFNKSTAITSEVIKYIEKYCELAPLHNPPALLAVKACKELLPNIPQVAVFDTAFHADMPRHAYLYGLP